MSRVVLAGYFGFGNLGDEAILQALMHQLRQSGGAMEFVVASGDPDYTRQMHQVERVVHYRDIAGLHEEISNSQFVVLGGGGLFEDYSPSNPANILTPWHEGLAYYAGIPLLCSLTGTPCFVHGVGIGPISTEPGRRMTAQAMRLAARVDVRDRESLELVQDMLEDAMPPSGLHCSSDLAFGLPVEIEGQGREMLKAAGLDPKCPTLALAMRPWDIGTEQAIWEVELGKAITEFSQEHEWQVAILPFHQYPWSAKDDLTLSRAWLARWGGRSSMTVIEDMKSPQDALELIHSCQAVVGMRLHSLIFAMLAGTKHLALAYDPKVSALMAATGQDHRCLAIHEWQQDQIQTILGEIVNDNGDLRLQEYVDRAAHAVKASTQELAGLGRGEIQVQEHEISALRDFALDRMYQSIELAKKEKIAREQRDQIHLDRNRVDQELTALRETLGVKLLDSYWNLARKLMPEGGGAKLLYRRVANRLRAILPGPDVHIRDERGFESGSTNTPLSDQRPKDWIRTGSELSSSDPRVELLRFEDHLRSRGVKQILAIVSTTDLVSSEGQRPTNFAHVLANRGIGVVFSSWRWGRSIWTAQDLLDKGIFSLPMDVLRRYPADLIQAFRGFQRTILFEFPYGELVPLLARANGSGWLTIYDAIDDWEAFRDVDMVDWYQMEMEKHFVGASDLTIAVNDKLASKLARFNRSRIEVVPNAARMEMAELGTSINLDRGEVTLGYFGHLSSAWFDWDLVQSVARAQPGWLIYLVGYGEERAPSNLPANIVMLGRRPQDHLSAFAANWDAGIVPFRSGPLADGADAIKVYEYLAMGLPVLVTGVQPPPGSEGLVFVAEGSSDFIETVELAIQSTDEESKRLDYASENTWEDRIGDLLRLIDRGAQGIAEKRFIFGEKR